MGKLKMVALLIAVGLSASVVAFLAGKRYGIEVADSGSRRRVLLKEDMVLLDSSGEPRGKIPAGTRLYAISDPYGDETSSFKLFVKTYAGDEGPLAPDDSRPAHFLERDAYVLRSQQSLKSR
jgi:hypothetical protein